MKRILYSILILFSFFALAQNEQIIKMSVDTTGYMTRAQSFEGVNRSALDTLPSIKYETHVNAGGAFTVTVPFEVPKGRGSLQPNIALAYSSQNGDGNAGWGWSLIGLSSISQGGKSKHIDGNNDGPQFDGTDPYYLDGERLIEISPNNFVTEKYSKIIITKQTSGEFSFIVTYTDGKIAKYKALMGQHYIVELSDAFNNIVTYTYDTGEFYTVMPLPKLRFINYHGGQIEFVYKQRFKPSKSYRNGVEYLLNHLLMAVEVKYQDENSQYQFLRQYQLIDDLIKDGGAHRLKKITVRNANDEQLRPLLFDYNSGQEVGFDLIDGLANHGKRFNPNLVHNNFRLDEMVMGDFFGNGKLSLLYAYKNGTSEGLYNPDKNIEFTLEDGYQFYSGKILRDNKITERDQLITFKRITPMPDPTGTIYFPTTNIQYSIAIKDLITNNKTYINLELDGGFYYGHEKYVQDFNNDGLVDVLLISKFENYKKALFAELGKHQNSDVPLQFIELNQLDNGQTGYTYPNFQKLHTIEFDGDGRVELMFMIEANKYSIFKIDLANQRLKPIPTAQNIILNDFGTDTPMVFGDYNGDGLTDFMTPDQIFDLKDNTIRNVVNQINTSTLNWKRYTSTGTGFIIENHNLTQNKVAYIKPSQGAANVSAVHNKKFTWKSLWSGDVIAAVSTAEYGTSHVFAMDINNDGRSDLVSLSKFGVVKIEQPTNSDYLKYSFSNANGNCSWGNSINQSCPYPLAPFTGYSEFQNVNKLNFHINKSIEYTGAIVFEKHEDEVDLRSRTMSPFSVFVPTSDFNTLNTFKPGFIYHDAMLESRQYEFDIKNFQEGQMTKIEDGSQNHIKVEYSQMLKQDFTLDRLGIANNDNPTYKTSSHGLQFPYYAHQNNPMHYLVSKLHTQIKLDNNPHHILTKEYRYENAMQHLDGRGFLGFQRTFSSDVYESKLQNGKYVPNNVLKPVFWTINTYDPELENANIKTTYGSLLDDVVFTKSETTYQKFTKPNNRYLILSTAENNKDFLKDITINKSYIYDTANDFLLTKAITNYNASISSVEEFEYEYEFWNGNRYFFGKINNHKNTSIRDGESFTSREEKLFDTDGTLLETKKFGHNTPPITSTYTYYPYGEIESETLHTDGMLQSLTTWFKYDATKRFVNKTITPDGLETTRNVNALGWVLSETSPLGHQTAYQHDGWGNVHTVTNYLGLKSKTKRQHNPSSSPGSYRIWQKTDHGPESITIFDSRDLAIETRTQTLNNQWVIAKKEYDIFGKTTRTSEPFYSGETIKWNTTEYDDLNRPIKNTTHNGKVLTTCYEKMTVTVEDGHRKHSRTLDPTGQTIKHTDAGGTVHYKYHPNGSLKETNYGGMKTTINIDGWGNKTRLVDPSAGTYDYEYDNLSRITKEINPKGGITTYTYDDLGRPLTESIVSATEQTDIQKNYQYDPVTFLPTKIKGTSNGDYYEYETLYKDPATNVPDPYHRIRGKKEITPNFTHESSTTYDAIGRVDETTQKTTLTTGYSAETKIKNTYNDLSILTEQNDITLNRQIWAINSIDARGNVTQMQYGNGYNITNQYNANTYMLEEIKHKRETANPVMHLQYNYNALKGVLDSRTNHTFSKTETYIYDDLDRLLSEHTNNVLTQAYTYDQRGRMTSNTQLGKYNYDESNYRLKGVEYNTSGNQVNTTRGFAQIQYNAFKNPTEIFLDGKDRISYDYGILKTRAVAYYGSTNTNKLARPIRKYFSSDKTVEVIVQGTTTKIISYLTGDPYSANYMKIDRLDSRGTTKTNYHLHRDNQGTILAITTANRSGTVIERRYFDAWGNLKEARIGTSNTPVLPNAMGWVTTLLIDRGYTGHEHLTTVGLIHMNGRIYDPILRQFMSPDNYVQDPYNTQNFNRFGYVLNNPLLYNDPSGEIIVPILIGAAVAVLTTAIANISAGIPFWHGMGKAAIVGAISGAISFGIGESVTGITSFWAKAGLQAGLHGMKSGMMSAIEGGSFLSGFAAGAISSLVSSGVEALGTNFSGDGAFRTVDGGFSPNSFGQSSGIKAVMIAAGGLSGGISSSIAGGSFWKGVREGIITSGLNHAMNHMVVGDGRKLENQRKPPKYKYYFQKIQSKYSKSSTIDNNYEASVNYYNGNFKPVNLGSDTQNALLNSTEYLRVRDRLVSGNAIELTYTISVDLTFQGAFFVGKTPLNYHTVCGSANCTTFFKAFEGDGFWDPLDIGYEIPIPSVIPQLLVTPKPYNFLPFEFSIKYKNPGYPINNK